MKFLVYGASGWIGGKMVALLQEKRIKTPDQFEIAIGTARLENRIDIEKDVDEFKPTHVINAAGLTGRPNIDWCEVNQVETLRTNIIGTLNLADICHSRDIHCTIFGTGCIYEYDESHPENGSNMFTENDPPNFSGSFYSKTKIMLEEMLKSYNNICLLRLRMPISDDLHPRNFITKITRYDKVINVPNSVTILADMLPLAIILSENNTTGIFNFTNPGAISHNEILDLYKAWIDPSFSYTNFTVDEQDQILMARRSNNELDVSKLRQALPECERSRLVHVTTSIINVFSRMQKNLKAV